MIIINGMSSIYLTLNKIPTVQEFINYFGVIEQSYMESLIIRIYNYIFYNCINLYEEYEGYYQQEYDTFFIFLKNMYGVTIDNNISIENQKKYYYTDVSWKSDYGISSILRYEEDNKFKETIIKFFEENE